MQKTFYFKFDRNENGNHRWVTNCGFCDEPEKNQFYLTAGDWDGCAGELDEWLFIGYDQISALKCLLSDKYPNFHNIELPEEACQFRNEILNAELKEFFLHLYVYFIEYKKGFSSFRELLENNGIESNYSAYRSSSDW